jgi:hypothetical protein
MVDVKERLDTYRTHPQAERRILQILSVIYTPINQTNLQKVLHGLHWKDPPGGIARAIDDQASARAISGRRIDFL